MSSSTLDTQGPDRRRRSGRLLAALALILGGCLRGGFGVGAGETTSQQDGPTSDAGSGDRSGRDSAKQAPGTWVAIAAGSFVMGSPPSELCRDDDEELHHVTLTHGFLMQTTEVTRGQFQRVLGYDPSQVAACGESCPVETVSWHEAAAYCNGLSALEGLGTCYSCTGSGASVVCQEATSHSGPEIYRCAGYRLPTEAEREHAYRAGTTSSLYNGAIMKCDGQDGNADAIGWHSGNAGGTTHPVAQRAPNGWGLHDMAGNVWEWCHERYQSSLGSAAVVDPWGAAAGPEISVRGGSWRDGLGYMRAANRSNVDPGLRSDEIGLRCVRTLLP